MITRRSPPDRELIWVLDEFRAALKRPLEDAPVIEYVDASDDSPLGVFGLDLARLSGTAPCNLETSFATDSGHTCTHAAIVGVRVEAANMPDWSWAFSFGRKLIIDESIALTSDKARRFEKPFFITPPRTTNPDEWRIGLRVYGPEPARKWRVRIELLGYELTRDAFEKISKEIHYG